MPGNPAPENVPSATFEALLDAAVDAIVVIDTRGLIRSFSRAAEEMFGYTPREIIGQNVSVLMPEPYRSEHDSYIDKFLETRNARIIGIGREVVACRKDGSTFPIDLSVGEIRHTGESGFVGIIRDLSNRHEMERTLKERQEELRLILENAPFGMALVDMSGRFIAANPSCERMLGYPSGALKSMSITDVTHPDDLPSLRGQAARALAGKIDHYEMTKRCICSDGSSVPVTMHIAIVHDENGDPLHQVIQVEDLRAEIETEQQLQDLRDRLAHVSRLTTMGEMAASIAHEINQPLTAIATYSEATQRLLDAGKTDSKQLDDVLGKIANQAHRASDVIARVRQLVRKGSGKRQVIDVNNVITEVIKLAEIDTRSFGRRIDVNFTDDMPLVVADPVQIQQVLLNLIRNALESTVTADSNSDIVVRTVCDDSKVRVAVTDYGTGLPENHSDTLFTPFVSSKAGGMGMGLAISRSIIESHGGALTARNNADGGATRTFSLPIADET